MKLLYYNTSDALSLSTVTLDKIIEMVGKGSNPNTQKCIYKYPFFSKIESTAHSELRFFITKIKPNNVYLADIPIYFQIICHNSIIDIDDNYLRPLEMLIEVLTSLNGTDVCGIGKLYLKERDYINMFSFSENYSGYEFCLYGRST